MLYSKKDTERLDQISGRVTNIINGNSFSLRVTNQSEKNKQHYPDYLTIIIQGRNAAPEFSSHGINQRQELMDRIGYKNVACKVIKADRGNIVLAEVYY